MSNVLARLPESHKKVLTKFLSLQPEIRDKAMLRKKFLYCFLNTLVSQAKHAMKKGVSEKKINSALAGLLEGKQNKIGIGYFPQEDIYGKMDFNLGLHQWKMDNKGKKPKLKSLLEIYSSKAGSFETEISEKERIDMNALVVNDKKYELVDVALNSTVNTLLTQIDKLRKKKGWKDLSDDQFKKRVNRLLSNLMLGVPNEYGIGFDIGRESHKKKVVDFAIGLWAWNEKFKGKKDFVLDSLIEVRDGMKPRNLPNSLSEEQRMTLREVIASEAVNGFFEKQQNLDFDGAGVLDIRLDEEVYSENAYGDIIGRLAKMIWELSSIGYKPIRGRGVKDNLYGTDCFDFPRLLTYITFSMQVDVDSHLNKARFNLDSADGRLLGYVKNGRQVNLYNTVWARKSDNQRWRYNQYLGEHPGAKKMEKVGDLQNGDFIKVRGTSSDDHWGVYYEGNIYDFGGNPMKIQRMTLEEFTGSRNKSFDSSTPLSETGIKEVRRATAEYVPPDHRKEEVLASSI